MHSLIKDSSDGEIDPVPAGGGTHKSAGPANGGGGGTTVHGMSDEDCILYRCNIKLCSVIFYEC